MKFNEAELLLRARLIECGIPIQMREASIKKMIDKGTILLIDRTGKHDDKIDWIEPKT